MTEKVPGRRRGREDRRGEGSARNRKSGPTAARLIAVRVLDRVERVRAFADLALQNTLAQTHLSSADRGLHVSFADEVHGDLLTLIVGDTVVVKPEWEQVIVYEYHMRRKALRQVNDSMPIKDFYVAMMKSCSTTKPVFLACRMNLLMTLAATTVVESPSPPFWP